MHLPFLFRASGTQHFSPTGKYKADGVLETVRLSGKLSRKLWLCLGTVSFHISKSSLSRGWASPPCAQASRILFLGLRWGAFQWTPARTGFMAKRLTDRSHHTEAVQDLKSLQHSVCNASTQPSLCPLMSQHPLWDCSEMMLWVGGRGSREQRRALMDRARPEEDKDGKEMYDVWTCRNCDTFPHVNCFTENFSFALFISF